MNVTVWRCDLDREIASLEMLDEAERARAAAFVFDLHRRRYVAAHCFLRTLLGTSLGIAPEAVRLAATKHGKPYLIETPSLAFNLSHADSIAYVAIASAGEIGVDVELHHHIHDLLAVARTVFSPEEVAEVASASGDERTARFLRCWTRKEAYVKALGVGLGAELPSITVHSSTSDIEVATRAGVSDSLYFVRTVESLPGEYVAIATSVRPHRIVVTDFNNQA